MTTGSFFYRLLAYGLLFFLVPAALTTAIVYATSAETVKSALLAERAERMQQLRERLNGELGYVTKAITSAALDPQIAEAIYDKELSGRTERLLLLHNRLSTFSQSLNNAYAVEIYFPSQGLLISNTQGVVPSSAMSESAMSLYLFAEALRKPVWTTTERPGQLHFVSFIQPLPIVTNFPQAYFAVHLNERGIANVLQSGRLTDREGSQAYVATREGKIVSHPDRNRLNEYVRGEEERQFRIVLQSSGETGHVPNRVSGTIMMYAKLDVNDWIVLYEVPQSSLYEVVTQLVRRHASLYAAIAALTAVAAFAAARRMYAPLRRLVAEEAALLGEKPERGYREWDVIARHRGQLKASIERLTATASGQHAELREAFLLRHLHGFYAGSAPEKLEALLDRFGLAAAAGAVALVIVPGRPARETAAEEDTEEAGPSAAPASAPPAAGRGRELAQLAEVCDELAEQFRYESHVVRDLPGDRLAVVLLLPADAARIRVQSHLRMLAEAIQHAARPGSGAPPTVGIGSIEPDAAGLPNSYRNALRALDQRLVRGEGLVYPLPTKEAGDPVAYPYEIEAALTEALKKNDREGCEDAFRRFLPAALHHAASAEEARGAFLLLYSHIIRTLDDMVAGSSEFALLNHSAANIWRAATAEELEEWFLCELFPTVFAIAEDISESRGAQTIEAVRAYLDETMTQNHSLSSVAEQVGISPSYLSRLFKKITGQSFVQYMANLKIEKAKQLLVTTNASVADIAEEVGYTERTFGRVFKNMTGTTPASYRLHHKR